MDMDDGQLHMKFHMKLHMKFHAKIRMKLDRLCPSRPPSGWLQSPWPPRPPRISKQLDKNVSAALIRLAAHFVRPRLILRGAGGRAFLAAHAMGLQ